MEDPAKTTQVDIDGFDLSAIIAGLDHGAFTSQYLVEVSDWCLEHGSFSYRASLTAYIFTDVSCQNRAA